jgi:hypothetical protein
MLYELVPGLARSLHPLVTLPNISIGSVWAAVKDEETVQQEQGDIENGNADLEYNLQEDIKQEALSGNVFF